MIQRWTASVVAAIALVSGVFLGNAPATAAPGCADIEVLWARGTAEPGAPIGYTGLAFIQALRGQTPGRSLNARGVSYAASDDFNNRVKFVESVNAGVKSAQNVIKGIAVRCPRSRIVFGGYSQGAVVAGYALVDKLQIPRKYLAYQRYAPPPLPASVTSHLAAVVFFGEPSARFIRDLGAPPIIVGDRFRPKLVRFCAPGDTICNGAPVGAPSVQHGLYPFNGMTVAAAAFVVRRL